MDVTKGNIQTLTICGGSVEERIIEDDNYRGNEKQLQYNFGEIWLLKELTVKRIIFKFSTPSVINQPISFEDTETRRADKSHQFVKKILINQELGNFQLIFNLNF